MTRKPLTFTAAAVAALIAASQAQADTVTVRWPEGDVSVLHDVPANQVLTVARCPADLDATMTVDVLDLLLFLSWWFDGDDRAERTGDQPPAVDVLDLLAYLGEWFSGC